MEFFELSSQKLKIVCILVLLLSACGQLSPYIDRRRNPGVQDMRFLYTGPSKPDKPAVCYNPLWNNDEQIQRLADEECVRENTGVRAVLVKKTHFDGKLFLPSHAYFKCVKE